MNSSLIFTFILTILGIWNIALTLLYIMQRRFFTQFTKGISKHDLKTVLKNIAQSLKTIDGELSDIDSAIKKIIHDNRSHFQRIGFIRFNPFSDTGGDQSFCLCLLDQENSGFIITSLHSREQTRIYSKSVQNGSSDQIELSKEETEALKRALQSGPRLGAVRKK